MLCALLLLFAVINAIHLSQGIKATNGKIDTLLNLNQMEIFSSLVLKDSEALDEHLDLLKKQYMLDYVSIKSRDITIETAKYELPFFYFWIDAFKPRFQKVIQNEFKTVGFEFTASYPSLIINDYFLPFLWMSFFSLLALIGVIYLFFKKQIKTIQDDIIHPLAELVTKIQNDDLEDYAHSSSLFEISILSKTIKEYPSLKKDRVIAQISSQVAHDIRSPLEALKASKKELSALPEEDRYSINGAINRIEEIAYNLLKMRKPTAKEHFMSVHTYSLLDQIILEKKMQYRQELSLNITSHFSEKAFACFVEMRPETLKRVISNLISNSAEAMSYVGDIEISLDVEGSKSIIKVQDTGPGISSEVEGNLFQKGFTTKLNGNGLGLFHAKTEVEAINGSIDVASGDRTTVSIQIPLVPAPLNFPKCIQIFGKSKIIVLDDDQSIHHIWNKRLSLFNIPIEHYYSAEALLSSYDAISEDCLLLSDYELLGEKITGLDCIKKLGAYKNSILVTARFEEVSISRAAQERGILFLPKSMALTVPITFNQCEGKQVVLIDDDDLIHMNWRREGKKLGVDVKTFFSVEDFIRVASQFSLKTPIYIDSYLGDGFKGEVLSEEIYKKGFQELFISTGYRAQDISCPYWIKKVNGKSFSDNIG